MEKVEKIFIVWHDYDGTYVEKFEANSQGKKKAERKYTDIMARAELAGGDAYGTHIDTVIQGKALTIKPIKVVSKVSLT